MLSSAEKVFLRTAGVGGVVGRLGFEEGWKKIFGRRKNFGFRKLYWTGKRVYISLYKPPYPWGAPSPNIPN